MFPPASLLKKICGESSALLPSRKNTGYSVLGVCVVLVVRDSSSARSLGIFLPDADGRKRCKEAEWCGPTDPPNHETVVMDRRCPLAELNPPLFSLCGICMMTIDDDDSREFHPPYEPYRSEAIAIYNS